MAGEEAALLLAQPCAARLALPGNNMHFVWWQLHSSNRKNLVAHFTACGAHSLQCSW